MGSEDAELQACHSRGTAGEFTATEPHELYPNRKANLDQLQAASTAASPTGSSSRRTPPR
jgi:hypothetical protein